MNPYLAHLDSNEDQISKKFDRPHKRFGNRPAPYPSRSATAENAVLDKPPVDESIDNKVTTTSIVRDQSKSQHQQTRPSQPLLPTNAYGNYPKYHATRNPAKFYDPRLSLLNPSWFENKTVLDIGCNSGDLTIQLACLFGPKYIEGVDIDLSLIRRAWDAVRYRASLCKNVGRNVKRKMPVSVCSGTLDMNYFPLSAPAMLGMLPLEASSDSNSSDRNDASTVSTVKHFPDNIHFRASDWLFEPPSPPHPYDCILALSVSKWIHLHHGDNGLLTFFKKAYDALPPNGRFILEPQPFDVYREGKLSEAMKENLKRIMMKPDRFSEVLTREIGFRKCSELVQMHNSSHNEEGVVERYEFRRPIYVFVK